MVGTVDFLVGGVVDVVDFFEGVVAAAAVDVEVDGRLLRAVAEVVLSSFFAVGAMLFH